MFNLMLLAFAGLLFVLSNKLLRVLQYFELFEKHVSVIELKHLLKENRFGEFVLLASSGAVERTCACDEYFLELSERPFLDFTGRLEVIMEIIGIY